MKNRIRKFILNLFKKKKHIFAKNQINQESAFIAFEKAMDLKELYS